MKSFQVLDRNQNIHHHHLLEASAGTGKTYSIENIVVRLLLEPNPHVHEPLQLEQILVVTFTRAAARDLKHRIRSNIMKALDCLSSKNLECGDLSPLSKTPTCRGQNSLEPRFLERKGEQGQVPDYLWPFLGKDDLEQAQKRLQQALFCFDQAQIFTIHRFCHRLLRDLVFEGGLSLAAFGGENGLPGSMTLRIVNDFLRSGLEPVKYSKSQLKILLGKYKGDLEKLKRSLQQAATGMEVAPAPFFSDYFRQFKTVRQHLPFREEAILADYDKLAPFYLKSERERMERFASQFAKELWDREELEFFIEEGIYWLEAFDSGQMKKRIKGTFPADLFYPALKESLERYLLPIISRARAPQFTMAALAHECQKHLKHYLDEEELLGFDDILHSMQTACQNPAFAEKVREKYKVAIIDEFQDTDPLQWDIFRSLFLNGQSSLYLVGDPKQSIYAFRQADIYTYLQAAESLGAEAHASLDTNYRSHPDMVEALNLLFDSQISPGWIDLPRLKCSLPYHPVKANTNHTSKDFKDVLGRVHFFTATGIKDKEAGKQCLMPYISKEIVRLINEEGMSPGQCAVLVKDRYQGNDMMAIFRQWNIPAVNQRQRLLAESPAAEALRELLQAVLAPRRLSCLKAALGGPLLGWSAGRVRMLDDQRELETVLIKFYGLRKALFQEGMSACIEQLFSSLSVAENLLKRENGAALYHDLIQLTEYLAEEQSNSHLSPDQLVACLEEILDEPDEEKAIKGRPDPDRDGVQVLTIHSSKGLEFDVVFALGLAGRSKESDLLVPDSDHKRLIPADGIHDPCYLEHMRELDAEKMRQLYVALTRAKHRLYVPAVFPNDGKKAKPGTASPMELFSVRFGQPATDHAQLYERIAFQDGSFFHGCLESLSSKGRITFCRLEKEAIAIEPFKLHQESVLSPPPRVAISGEPIYMHSYSTLTKGAPKEAHAAPSRAPHDFHAVQKTPHTLPSGSEVGNLLHSILEVLPFEQAADIETVRSLVRPFVKGTSFANWEDVILQTVLNCVNAPLPLVSGPIPLRLVDPSKIFRETEFLFPIDEALLLPEMERVAGLLKGVIDLVFEHEGMYYLLDWKSNWLGPSSADYQYGRMYQAMQNNHYLVQAHIYKEAFRRYLKLVDPRPFESIYGGMFYVFMRGLELEDGVSAGIFKMGLNPT